MSQYAKATWKLTPKQLYHLQVGCGGELDDIMDGDKVVARICRRCGVTLAVIQEATVSFTSTWASPSVEPHFKPYSDFMSNSGFVQRAVDKVQEEIKAQILAAIDKAILGD